MAEINEEIPRLFEKARQNVRLTGKQAVNRRGDFTSITVGYSHGGGQVPCQNLASQKPALIHRIYRKPPRIQKIPPATLKSSRLSLQILPSNGYPVLPIAPTNVSAPVCIWSTVLSEDAGTVKFRKLFRITYRWRKL